MTAFEELHSQNHKLIESAQVLMYLLKERSMCDTDTACGLLYSFIDSLNDHMGRVGSLYQTLLNDNEQSTNNTARLFLSGDQELNRIIKQYTKKWCVKKHKQLKIGDHDEFKHETIDLFELVLNRIQDETEHLYPLVRKTNEKSRQAA